MQEPRPPKRTFEDTYPRYPFAPLVTLAITLARWWVRHRAARAAEHRSARKGPAPKRGLLLRMRSGSAT